MILKETGILSQLVVKSICDKGQRQKHSSQTIKLITVPCHRKRNWIVNWYKVWPKKSTFFWLPKLFEATGPGSWIPSTNFRHHKCISMSTAKEQKEHLIWWKEMEEWFPASNNNCLTISKQLYVTTLHFFIYKSRDIIPAYYFSGL